MQQKTIYSDKHNDNRCIKCKRNVLVILEKLYGDVIQNYNFRVPLCLENHYGTRHYPDLKIIYHSLQNLRNHRRFIRSKHLPPVDFYIPNPGFILEFDESQHFTMCRKKSLSHYPKRLQTGFDLKRWSWLCDEIQARDNDPIYRDEQRAWYDTLRDFLPSIKGLKPTIRLFSKDFKWCDLDPNSPSDLKLFKKMIEGRITPSMLNEISNPAPTLARIVIAGEWSGNVRDAKKLLSKVIKKWPKGNKVDCMITCGAFLNFDWPSSINDVGDNKYPKKKIITTLLNSAQEQCEQFLDRDMRRNLSRYTDYITIGIDTYKDDVSKSYVSIRHPHAELVAVVDMKTKRYYWTGKSYPTTGQEMGLIRFQDLRSHFMNLKFGKVLVLGCHDLNAFNPRGNANTKRKWRHNVQSEFEKMVKKKKPAVALHHPHTTDSTMIWTPTWHKLVRISPSITRYLSAGRYSNEGKRRKSLKKVLEKTKCGATLDFIVYKDGHVELV